LIAPPSQVLGIAKGSNRGMSVAVTTHEGIHLFGCFTKDVHVPMGSKHYSWKITLAAAVPVVPGDLTRSIRPALAVAGITNSKPGAQAQRMELR
jgi:hypothetical protein